MAISVLSWNVQEFGKKTQTNTPQQIAARVKRVAKHIGNQNPDVFGILELERLDILSLIEDEFPGYDFSFTDGPQNSKEILVGSRQNRFDQVVFSQKRQFNLYNPYLRPGALLSVRQQQTWTNFLFLHTDSGTEARDFGNRYEMFDKVWSLRESLDKKAGQAQRERLVVLGDLNTMGLFYPRRRKKDHLVTGASEVTALREFAAANAMQVLAKSHANTWKKLGRTMVSDLDHVMASDQVLFDPLGQDAAGNLFQVQVAGWVDLPPAQREKFLKENSDHCSLFCRLAD